MKSSKLIETLKTCENTPFACRQKVAIIIPFKDRDAHLKTLLYYLHPMLQRQQIHY